MLPLSLISASVQRPLKTSISKGKEKNIATKFSFSYIRVSCLQQTKVDNSGIRRQDEEYIDGLKNHLKEDLY